MTEQERQKERAALVQLLRSRRNQDFDGECHLTNEEAQRLILALKA